MLRNTPLNQIIIVSTTSLLIGLVSSLPLRSSCSCAELTRHGSVLARYPRVEYLVDLVHPSLFLLVSLILATSITLIALMLFSPAEPVYAVSKYLLIQGAATGIATLGVLAMMNFGFDSHGFRYHMGFTSLWVLGLWTSAVSGLWGMGRLRPWLG